MAANVRHDSRVHLIAPLAYLDPLLGGATLVVESNDPFGGTAHVGHDKADPGIKFARMPLDLGDHPARLCPTSCLIGEVGVVSSDFVRRSPDWTLAGHSEGRIATQYCSFTAKKGTKPIEWLAQHEDAHFDSFNKLCFAVSHDIDEHYSRARLREKETINIQMYHPILVVAGDIIDVVPTRKELKLRAKNHIHYVHSYAMKGKQQQYHIDVVTEKYFPRLLKLIDSEMRKTVLLIRRRKKPVEESVDRIAASVKGLRSPEAIQRHMEYRGPWDRD